MKFERRFLQLQDPKWAGDYFRYRAIKTLLKDASVRTEAAREALAFFNEDVERVEQCYRARLASIERKQTLVFEQHRLNDNFLVQRPILREHHNREEIVASFLEIISDLEALQRFAENNQDALQRLLCKFNANQRLVHIDNGDDDDQTGKCLLELKKPGFSYQVETYYNAWRIKKAVSDLLYDYSNHTQGTDHISSAEECNRSELVQSVLCKVTNINHWGPFEEPMLYTASRWGRNDIVNVLLNADFEPKIDMDSPESVRGWTPLIIACVEGHLSVVKLLVEAGADQLKYDRFGWTAKEHATFRGHLKIAALLETPKSNEPLLMHSGVLALNQALDIESAAQTDNGSLIEGTTSHILITLGSPNLRERVRGVDLNIYQHDSAQSTAPLLSCVLDITAIGADALTEKAQYVQLPRLEEAINQPWHFVTKDLEQVKLVFRISRPRARECPGETTIGNGVALLKSLRHGLASTREGLARYYTVAILEKTTSEYMGTVTFGLVVVTPAPQAPSIPWSAKRGFWDGGPTQIVGHRGSGANTPAHTHLQLGENTIQSFTSAAALGASAVEFDVQLTKDLVPVIYHDFLVMEAGGDNPIYTLRLNQFLHLSQAQQTKGDLAGMAEKRYMQRNKDPSGRPSKQRSFSCSVYDESAATDLMDRMKHTEAAMQGLHKGNLVGDSIHGMFPTFEDLFTNLPESVAFNVEMKYPMLWEAEDRNMDSCAPEINAYVNIVLSIIYRLGGKRSITFSSFSPEVCILLTLKQRDYPVLFLSKAGSIPVGDIRCSGLQQSIKFAKRWNLAGIVILSDPLVMCPRLIGYAKSAGLKICSYGPLNNNPDCAKIQAKAGLDVIIVDKVRLISETLARC